MRCLACVGVQPYWAGREVDPRWPDYREVLAGTTQLALACGVRVQWTLFGDAQVMAPTQADRERVVDTVAAICVAQREAVIAAEVANEWWQNGFSGSAGIQQMRGLAARFASRCDVAIATSCPVGANEEEQKTSARALYEGSVATYTTNHYDRTINTVDDGWRPARQPWQQLSYDGVPDGSLNNEPIGIGTPGGNNPTDSDPYHQVSAAIVSWISGHWGYCLHDRTAGVRMDKPWSEVENIDAITGGLQKVRPLLPADLPAWSPQNNHWAGHPWQRMPHWPDGTSEGVVRAYAAIDGPQSVCLPMGIKNGVTLTAKAPMLVAVHDVLTGDLVREQAVAAGGSFRLDDSPPVYLVLGR